MIIIIKHQKPKKKKYTTIMNKEFNLKHLHSINIQYDNVTTI